MSGNSLSCIENVEAYKATIKRNRKQFLSFIGAFLLPTFTLMVFNWMTNTWPGQPWFLVGFLASVAISMFIWVCSSNISLSEADPLKEGGQRNFLKHLETCSEYPEVVAFVENIKLQKRRPLYTELKALIEFSMWASYQKSSREKEENAEKLWESSIKTVSPQEAPSAG